MTDLGALDVEEVPAEDNEPVEIDGPETCDSLPVVARESLPVIPGENEFRSLAMQAKLLSESSLIPDRLRGKPHDVLLILMTGRDLGIAPTAALRKCYVVEGNVTIAPSLKAALVKMQGKGYVRPAQGNSKDSATVIAYGPDGNEITRATLTWDEVKHVTIDKDHKKKLVDKDNWKNWPARMLYHRCQGWLIDDIWPEVSFGIYTPDDLNAVTDENGQMIDVREVEVPAGYEKRRNTPDRIDKAVGEALRDRANGLPGPAIALFRQFIRDRDITGFPILMEASKAKVIEPFLANLEKRAAAGEWPGENATQPAEPPTGGDPVEKPAHVDDDGVISEPAQEPVSGDARLSGHTIPGLSTMTRTQLLALPEGVVRAAAETASDDPLAANLQHAELVDLFLHAVEPF